MKSAVTFLLFFSSLIIATATKPKDDVIGAKYDPNRYAILVNKADLALYKYETLWKCQYQEDSIRKFEILKRKIK